MSALKDFLKQHWPRLRLRSILFGVLLFVAVLPLIGIIFFRSYETSLVQSTETELIMQGAVFASAYSRAVATTNARANPVMEDLPPDETKLAATRRHTKPAQQHTATYRSTRRVRNGLRNEVFVPRPPRIDILTDTILPARPEARAVTGPIDAISLAAGRAVLPILLQATRTTLASVRIVNANGQVVAGRSEVGRSLAHLREIAAALKGHTDSTLRRKSGYRSRYPVEIISRAASTRVFHSVPAYLDGKVVGAILLSRSPKSVFIRLYDNTAQVAFAIMLLLLAILAIAALLSRSITRPVSLLVDSARKVARGEVSLPPPPATAAIEIQELFVDIEVMATTIDQRSNYIKNFAASVSHEFKTPLSGIRGAIELMQEHDTEMSESERRRFLANVSQDAQRLDRLVTRLLQLARADVLAPGDESVVLGEVLPVLQRDFDSKGMKIDISMPADRCTAAISSVALETILTNLLNNSLQHQANRVEMSVRPEISKIYITLTDNGTGISEEDKNRIFAPFFTTRRTHGGTGLGLAIAQSLAKTYGGIINLENNQSGASFKITLRRVY